MSTILVIKKTESPDVVSAGNQMSGYQVQLEVTDSAGINPKIFIMQREVISAGDGGVYEDQFYSVASVAQLESVPEAPTSNLPFYRVSSVSLIFGTIEDREKYTSTILAMIEKLRVANDLAINLSAEVEIGFPSTAIPRFWGFSEDNLVPVEELLAGPSDNVSSKEFSKVLENLDSDKYFYFATRSSLGEIETILVNGVSKAFATGSVAVEIQNGFSPSYFVYRTTQKVGQSSSILIDIE